MTLQPLLHGEHLTFFLSVRDSKNFTPISSLPATASIIHSNIDFSFYNTFNNGRCRRAAKFRVLNLKRINLSLMSKAAVTVARRNSAKPQEEENLESNQVSDRNPSPSG